MLFARFSFTDDAATTTTTTTTRTIIERPLGVSTSMLDLRSTADGDFEMVTVHGKPAWTRQHRRMSDRAPQPHFRVKSYSETGPVLEKMVQTKARPYSAGTAEDIRRVCISGFSKNRNGTWMFKVDIGSDVFDSYAVRRRFSDFKELYIGLQELGLAAGEELPELPHHGVFSVMQMFFSPEPALSHRARKLEEILQFVNSHPVLSESAPFVRFIGKAPSSLEVGYVSLSCYDAPSADSWGRLSSSGARGRGSLQLPSRS